MFIFNSTVKRDMVTFFFNTTVSKRHGYMFILKVKRDMVKMFIFKHKGFKNIAVKLLSSLLL